MDLRPLIDLCFGARLEADPAAAAPVVRALERALDVELELLGSYRAACPGSFAVRIVYLKSLKI